MPALGRMPVERAIWYLPAFWAGVLYNDVTAGIPVDRLLASDIAKRPGAISAVVVISLVIFVIVLVQANSVRKTGWLLTYLGWYGLVSFILLILAMIPGLQFRFHHYFAGLFIMPATGFANRPSAVYQAFLLGMFLNGAGKWGFDSILQTVEEVRRECRNGYNDTDTVHVASAGRPSRVIPPYLLHKFNNLQSCQCDDQLDPSYWRRN